MEKKRYNRKVRHALMTPLIWLPLFGILISDLFLEIYHHVCFPLFGLPLVERKKYVRIDRYKLKYLGPIDKLGCIYCGYANGWLHYATVIGEKTERYFCGIKHKQDDSFVEPNHHTGFTEYGNEDEYRKKYFTR